MIDLINKMAKKFFGTKADKDIEDALRAFDTFSVRYQGAVDEPLPEFRRPKAPVRDVA